MLSNEGIDLPPSSFWATKKPAHIDGRRGRHSGLWRPLPRQEAINPTALRHRNPRSMYRPTTSSAFVWASPYFRTLTMLLGEFLAFRHSKNVLLIDMDAQANLSYCMVPDHQIQRQRRERRTAYYLLLLTYCGPCASMALEPGPAGRVSEAGCGPLYPGW